MFTIPYRDQVRNVIIEKARQDERIVAAAVVGSYAQGNEDRWSDIDLTFGVKEGFKIIDVLQSWTEYIYQQFSGVVLLDVQRGNTTYRVFMLPGCLQVDLSFSLEKDFGAVGQSFKLLYGNLYKMQQPKSESQNELFGWLIHHLIRARFCVERNRLWQAEYWISEARDYSLKLACFAHNLNADYARGFDDLPIEILAPYKQAFVKEISRDEILRVIKVIMSALYKISNEVNKMIDNVKETLTELETI